MLKMKKKNGFTLVELLAVIVILAVVMLIGVTVIGPIMARSQKGALGTEGLDIINAAQLAYQTEQLNASSAIKNNSTVCFDLQWLKENNYFSKGKNEDYYGSVLVKYDSGTYIYKFWLTNKTYTYKGDSNEGIEKNSYTLDQAKDYATDDEKNTRNCGGQSVNVKCNEGASCQP